jgi:hypothetical protein
MTRSQMGMLLGLLTVALGTGTAAAQTTAPTSTPMSQPSTAPLPTTPTTPTTPTAGATPAAAPGATQGTGASEREKPAHGPQAFLAGDYMWGTFSKNEFNTLGENDKPSFAGRAAISYPFGKLNVMAEGTYDHFQYFHLTGPVQLIGGGTAIVPTFLAHQTDWDGRAGIGLPYPRTFLVASYGQRRNNFNRPNLQGFGFGIEKLPDFDHKNASFFGSYLWYPQFAAGNFLQYGLYKYSFGIEIHAKRIPVFLEFGVLGDYAYAKKNAPTYLSDSSVISGIGLHF